MRMTEDNTPIRLLIVDDEEDLVTFLAHRLRKRGVDVTMALSGAELNTRTWRPSSTCRLMPFVVYSR